MSFNKMGKLIKYDIYWGILNRWKKYAALFIVSATITVIFIRKNQFYYDLNQLDFMPGFLDYVMNMFHGMKPYIPDSETPFEIPVEWMFCNLYIAFLIGNYIIDDLEKCGINVITRVQSRKTWIISKVIWNICTVLSFYVIIYGVNVIVSLAATGEIQMNLTEVVCDKFFDMHNINTTQLQVIIAIVILPLLSSLAISQMQMFLSLMLKPIVSFMVIASVMILSAYTMSPYLIGNYSMVQRSELFIAGGIDMELVVVVNIIIFAISAVGSVVCFSKKNIV